MFKVSLLLCVVATFATEAPVISLDLSHTKGLVKNGEVKKTNPGLSYHAKKDALVKAGNTKATSFVHKCPAGESTSAAECALPTARAYDHHQGTVAVASTIMLLTGAKQGEVDKIKYNKKAEYLVKYNAADDSGNKAEQVIFAVILDDPFKPKFSGFIKSRFVQDAKQKGNFYPYAMVTPMAKDNLDGDVSKTIKVTTTPPTKKQIDLYKIATGKKMTYTIYYEAHDFAGIFGNNGKNNIAKTKKTFTVQDITPPTIHDPKNSGSVECARGASFTSKKATVTDNRDATKTIRASTTTYTKSPTGTRTITYTTKDAVGNAAKGKSFTVTVKDTTAPKVILDAKYITQHSSGSTVVATTKGVYKSKDEYTHFGGAKGDKFLQYVFHTGNYGNNAKIFTCSDSCCAAKDIKKTHSWVSSCSTGAKKTQWNELKPGTYYHVFTCTDCNGRKSSVCRTVVNEDKAKPIIDVLGKDVLEIQANHDNNYVDNGATCSDQVDGPISQDVEVSGDVVNLAKVGAYKIAYNCKDAAGNAAEPATRIVNVVDLKCPTCNLIEAATVTREASFPYTDAGAVCTDSLDGKIAYAKNSNVDVELTGKYYVTYTATDKTGKKNCGIHTIIDKDGVKSKVAVKNVHVRTVYIKDTLKPVIGLFFNKQKIHESSSSDKGISGETNPAGAKFMAETSSVNGWVIAAVASAVAGIALLASSTQKTATSVPV
jgi:hypothetical protein